MTEMAQAYDAGLADGKLLLQHCDKCDRAVMYPKYRCPHCGGSELSWQPASGRGTLYSMTVQFLGAPSAFSAQLPYALGVVRLAEGVQLLARLLPGDDGAWSAFSCDGEVEFVPRPAGVAATERPCAWFRPVP